MADETGIKKQRDLLRTAMCDQGCTLEQIAATMGRQFRYRPRAAWRHAHGWTQDEVAAAYNRQLGHDQAPMTDKRISGFEAWPHGGKKPLNALAMLAKIYSTDILNLVDPDDRQAMTPQELINLDAHKPPPAAAASRSPDALTEKTTQNPAVPGESALPRDSNISIAIRQNNHMPEATTSPQCHRWDLILTWLLAIITAIGGAVTARTLATEPHTTMPMPARTFPPSPPDASGPSSTPLLSPSLPSQTAPPQQPLIPLSSLTLAAPAPRQLSTRAPILPAPPPSTRPDSLPVTAKAANVPASFTWENMYSGLCLDEQDQGDTGTLRLWPCNGSVSQLWTEQAIPAHPASIAKNLVSKSGKCVTYQPGPGDQISVWLAPCGKDGQGWHRDSNGKAYFFHAVEIPGGACMSAPNSPTTEGLTDVQLQPCDPPSSLTDWLPHP